MSQSELPSILVLGVGNVLFMDEGIGVRCLRAIDEAYEFSDNVTLMDGGTLGMRLMDHLMQCDVALVLDAVLAGGEPGELFRFTGDDLRKSLSFRNSLHQTDLVDALIYCELMGKRPEAVVMGMQPFDYEALSIELSQTAQTALPRLAELVVAEVVKAGGEVRPRTTPYEEVVGIP